MNKLILFLMLGSLGCIIQCALPNNKGNKRTKKVNSVSKVRPVNSQTPVKQLVPSTPNTNPTASLSNPSILPAITPTIQPTTTLTKREQNKGKVEIRLSDKTIYLTKEQAEAFASKKITESGITFADYPSPIELNSMDSKAFEFMQKLTALSAQKLYTFLDKTNDDAFALIRLHANLLQLTGNFETACTIKMATNPQKYGKTEDWAHREIQKFAHYELNSDGTQVRNFYGYPQYTDKTTQYVGSEYYEKYLVDHNLYDKSPEEYYKESERNSKALNALYLLIGYIHYYQTVFQKPAPLTTDFLKESFYKLDISHQNKLINDNLVVLA